MSYWEAHKVQVREVLNSGGTDEALVLALMGIGDILDEMLEEYRADEEAAAMAQDPRVAKGQTSMGLGE